MPGGISYNARKDAHRLSGQDPKKEKKRIGRIKQTCLERHGYENAMLDPEIQKRSHSKKKTGRGAEKMIKQSVFVALSKTNKLFVISIKGQNGQRVMWSQWWRVCVARRLQKSAEKQRWAFAGLV